jgi:hypothetical protein
MKSQIMFGIVATVAAIGLLAASSVAYANAAPQAAHGTCGVGDGSFNGALGCAGNVGGFILSPGGRCIEQNTPNSVFTGTCS